MFLERRKKLIDGIKGDASIVLFSGNAINKSEDEYYPFCVNRNFYYLTGLDKESMILLINKTNDVVSEQLFILPFDEKLAKWVGGRMLADEASQISEIKDVLDFEDFKDTFANILNKARKNPGYRLYADLWCVDANQTLTPAIKFVNGIKESHPAIVVQDIYPLIGKMRLVKDEYEIDCIRKAIETTSSGVRVMISSIKPGLNEMAMEGVFNFVLAQRGCKQYAFDTICASGKRATVLHYHENNQVIEDGDIFLCDLGATYKNYCADISRSFPANGEFNERQKEIYEIVLNAQKLVEENAKPGVSLRILNQMVVDYYKEELPKHGLTKDVREYYWHSVSHHLGLDCHDIDGGLGLILEKGNVITNEPGLYIEEENIGIRIEDDLLITDTGCEVLSSMIPKTVEEIEEITKGNE